MPGCSRGAITMKMMSSTSITSTMGVTLMLEFTLGPSFRTLIAIVPSSFLPAGLAVFKHPDSTQSEFNQCIGHRSCHFCSRPAEVRLAEVLHKGNVWAAAGLRALG